MKKYKSVDLISFYYDYSGTLLQRFAKNVPKYCSMLVKYEPISIKIDRRVRKETLNIAGQNFPTSLKICALTTLENLK